MACAFSTHCKLAFESTYNLTDKPKRNFATIVFFAYGEEASNNNALVNYFKIDYWVKPWLPRVLIELSFILSIILYGEISANLSLLA